MLSFLADHNFNGRMLRGLKRRLPDLDLVSVAELGPVEVEDPTVLAWAAEAGRLVLTHDVSTMPRYAYERIDRGQSMPGVLVVGRRVSIGRAVEELALLAVAGFAQDFDNQVVHIPL